MTETTETAHHTHHAAGSRRLFFEADDERYLAELAEYVAIASVSRDADRATMQQAAEWTLPYRGNVNGCALAADHYETQVRGKRGPVAR